jgi:4-hydroxy-2-oxoheptanedioate aldolase
MKTNSMKMTLRSGGQALGGWCSIASSFSAEIVASVGFDYVCVDLQHGLAAFSDLVPMLQAIAFHGPTPLVRVPFRDVGVAQRALDAGAEGLIFPLVNGSADARAAVDACRYPPIGQRSYGPIRARMHIGPDPDHANQEILCIAMVETAEAVDNLEAIVSCPGIDVIYVGPNDLALGLGLQPGTSDPRFRATMDLILKVCSAKGIPVGLHANSGAAAREALDRGFAMATIATDAVILTGAYRAEFANAARAESEGSPG